MSIVDWNEILRHEIAWAITQRRQLGVGQDEAFQVRVQLVGPSGQVVNTPIRGRSSLRYTQMPSLSPLST